MKKLWFAAVLVVMTSTYRAAEAAVVNLDFSGPGVQAAIQLDYGPAIDTKYPDAFVVNNVTGTVTDTNNGLNIVDAPILGLIPVNFATPEPTNLLAPNAFSRFAVASGLAPISNGFLTYDNLYWPGGAPQTASDYSGQGGLLDIYGLMLDIGGGRVVNLWSNGDFGSGADYGMAVANADVALDYVQGGVLLGDRPLSAPGGHLVLAFALIALLSRRRAAG